MKKKQENNWMEHVKECKKKNPKMGFSELLREAKKSYHKK